IRDASRAVLVLVNPDLAHRVPLQLPLSPLPPRAGGPFVPDEPADRTDMAPGDLRILPYLRMSPVIRPMVRDSDLQPAKLAATRIVIEAIRPHVPDGPFAVKRLVGETITVSADIIADGHDVLAAALLWRAGDETEWRRVPMRLTVNDRWEGSFTPARV